MTLPARDLPSSALSALTEAAAAISSTLELDGVLQTIPRMACSVTHAEASSVFLLDGPHARLIVVAATGHRREALLGQAFDASLGMPGHVVRTGHPLNIADARHHSRYSSEIDNIGSLQTRDILAVPMLQRGEVLGVIEVVNRLDGQKFSDADLKILQIFATMATGATQNARTHDELRRRFEVLRDSVSKGASIIGHSPTLSRALDLCARVAPSNATVLIVGETGTGKELCARYIHSLSKRRHETFAAINCAALPEALLESELFGHEKGAFTSAHAQRSGWFELANRGTLFLDEIGEISRSTQAKLLRVIQEKEFVRVGGTRMIACDVRLIATTNRDLKAMIAEGSFREDLYYRLNVFPIQMPPLRERQEDIPLLVDYFAEHIAQDFRVPKPQVAPETMGMLVRYRWPGNIRELRNVLERSVLINDGDTLAPCHLPPDIEAAASVGGEEPDGSGSAIAEQRDWGPSTLYGHERALIRRVLVEQNWNQSRAARALGITRDHLRHRIEKYGLRKDVPKPSASGLGSPPTEVSGQVSEH